ncbi:MAG: ribosome-associated translation inhibitor RaiA [Pseudomonadota bacterium]
MRIQVTGKQIDVGDALRTHVSDRLGDVVGKYSGRPAEATVTFSRDAHLSVCDATVHLDSGLTAKSEGRAPEIYTAFDACLERMDKQLRRYKRRLKNHHRPQPAMEADYSVLTPVSEDSADESTDLPQPVIVAETKTAIRTLSVGEAVMEMELANAPVLVFRNGSHGGVNVVYRREDGHIGWVDPRNLASA